MILLQELYKDPLHVLTDAFVLVISRYRPIHMFFYGCFSLQLDIDQSIVYA